VHLLADLSDWLRERGLSAADLTGEVGGSSCAHGARQSTAAGSTIGGGSDSGLRRGLGVAPPAATPSAGDAARGAAGRVPCDVEDKRGLTACTVVHYLRYARLFLTWLPVSVEQSLPQLSAGQVIDTGDGRVVATGHGHIARGLREVSGRIGHRGIVPVDRSGKESAYRRSERGSRRP
jgi:hypothetical protein